VVKLKLYLDGDEDVGEQFVLYDIALNEGSGTEISNSVADLNHHGHFTNAAKNSNTLVTEGESIPAPDREDIRFFSGGETGAVQYDASDFADDSHQSAQVWGPDGSSSVANGTAGVYVDDTYSRVPGGKAIRVVLDESWGQRGGYWRNELRSPAGRNFLYGDTHFTAFSLYIPDDPDGYNATAVGLTRLNQSIMNFHHQSGAWGIHTYDGKFRLNVGYLTPNYTDWVFGQADTGVWHDFRIKIKPHFTQGIMEIEYQKDGGGYTKVIDRQNVRTVNAVDDYTSPKFGIYRSDTAFGSSVGVPRFEQVFDEIRDSLPNLGSFSDVTPGGVA
jgi:hypothetical protein